MLNFRSALYYQECRLHKHPLDNYQEQSYCQREAQSTSQHPCTLFPVPTSVCLSRQATCSDAQKTEIPIEQVKKHGAYGNATYHSRCAGIKMTGNGNIHHSYQRNGNIGQNTRHRQFQYISVNRFHKIITSFLSPWSFPA